MVEAGALQLQLKPLIDALFLEVNPIPVKTALHLMGYCDEVFRLPMCGLSSTHRKQLEAVLESYQLI